MGKPAVPACWTVAQQLRFGSAIFSQKPAAFGGVKPGTMIAMRKTR